MAGLIEAIERMEAVDPAARLAQKLLYRVVPQQSIRKDLLSGTWLGRPLHPILTDVVIGTWISASLLDLLADERTEPAADLLLAIGNLSAVPTMAAGLSDWAELWGGQQRLGSIHALTNAVALALQVQSYKQRREGSRTPAKLLSLAAVTTSGVSAYLGGHLSFVKGVGVNRTAFESWPQEWTPVIAEDQLADGMLTLAHADDIPVVLFKQDEQIYALSDRCSHRGCPLHLGQVNDLMLECPCHGSVFRLSDGTVMKGPATVAAPFYEVRHKEGRVEVRRSTPSQWGGTSPIPPE